MKKNYLKLKIILIAIVVVIMVAGCSLLTYEKAVAVQQEYIDEVHKYADILAEYSWDMYMNGTEEDFSNIVKQTYYKYYEISSIYYDIGFYSMLKDGAGNTLANEQNFILIAKNNASLGLEDSDKRIILLGNELITDNWCDFVSVANNNTFSRVEIKGVCDDKFVYLEEFKFVGKSDEKEYVYKPKVQVPESDNLVSFESWAGGNTFSTDAHKDNHYWVYAHATNSIYGDMEKKNKLNKEAKMICEKIYEAHREGWNILNHREDDGLLTTYIASTGYINEEYSLPYVFVFHPLETAMEELASVYVMIGMFAIGVIVFIWFMIDNVYKKQLAYENNRRELTRGIAHELKTPLAITKGYLENWEYLGETERQESSKTMIAEIAHMDRMVTDLLELSHLEAKAKKLNLESVDLQALARSVVGRMKPIIDERQLTISGNIFTDDTDGEKYLGEADLEMMRVVLVNLVSNAVKYADKEINISLSENGKRVGFVIANDGQTVSVDNIGKVWDEFYRDETVDAKRIGGSGLGLAITKNVLILHGAKYGCKSEQGRTTFWFEIKR